jgi:hypothetical protein
MENPTVTFIMNKQEIGNVHTALKTIVTENLSAGPKEDGILMSIMGALAPIYDKLAHGDIEKVTLDAESAHHCWKALSYVMENALAPESQQAKLISLIQHMGFALEVLGESKEETVEIEPKDVAQLDNVVSINSKRKNK